MSVNEANVFQSKCSPGNECRLTVENAIQVKDIKEDIQEMKSDIKKLVWGGGAALIIMLANWVWQLATRSAT